MRLPANLSLNLIPVYWDEGKGFLSRNRLVLRACTGYVRLLWRAPRNLRGLFIGPFTQPLPPDAVCVTVMSKWDLFSCVLKRLPGQSRRLNQRVPEAWRRLKAGGGLNGLAEMIARKMYPSIPALQFEDTYSQWIGLHEPPESVHPLLKSRVGQWAHRPLISVLMPTYNTPEVWLRAAIESVRRQVYENWELCIADDASPQPHVRRILDEYAAQDARIKVVYRPGNGHISEASNSALALVTGTHVALFDHDDELHPLALYCTAQVLNQQPDAQIIYSDEDKLTEDGKRSAPYFKTDFNYELFLSQNMISHLGVYRTSTVRVVGGFRTAFNGSQDYDLALRVMDHCHRRGIVHIPHVLYHWRVHSASTAQSGDAKPYAHLAALAAIQSHLDRQRIEGEVVASPLAKGCNRVRYKLPADLPLVDIIIPIRDAQAQVERCIRAILKKTAYGRYRVTLVDIGSTDAKALRYLEGLATHPRVRVLKNDSLFNYSALHNRAVQTSSGDLVCLMNDEVEVATPEWLDEMVSLALQKGVGCVGARLVSPGGTLQHAGVLLGGVNRTLHAHKHLEHKSVGYFGRAVLHSEFSAVTGACLLVSRSIYLEVNGLDERLATAYNDIDFCLRVRQAGYRTSFTPYAQLIHHGSALQKSEKDDPEETDRFRQAAALFSERWADPLEHDPFYSPNLTLEEEDFSMAWPPRTARFFEPEIWNVVGASLNGAIGPSSTLHVVDEARLSQSGSS